MNITDKNANKKIMKKNTENAKKKKKRKNSPKLIERSARKQEIICIQETGQFTIVCAIFII